MSNKASDQSARTASILKTDITRENTITRSSSSNNDNYHHHNNINNYNESAKTGEDANKENIPNLEEEIAAFRIFRKKSTSNLKSSHTTSNLVKKTMFKRDRSNKWTIENGCPLLYYRGYTSRQKSIC